MKKKLLREFVKLDYDRNMILESKEKQQPIIVSGILQRANAINANKRIYPRDILEREISNYEKAVRENRAVGQLDHPESSVVELEHASHIVRELWWNGDEVCGKVEILNTPKGLIAQQLMEAGVQLGISSRGVGETIDNGDGSDTVDDSYMLIAFDIVQEPSTSEAFLFKESKIIDFHDPRDFVSKNDRINRIVNEILNNSSS